MVPKEPGSTSPPPPPPHPASSPLQLGLGGGAWSPGEAPCSKQDWGPGCWEPGEGPSLHHEMNTECRLFSQTPHTPHTRTPLPKVAQIAALSAKFLLMEVGGQVAQNNDQDPPQNPGRVIHAHRCWGLLRARPPSRPPGSRTCPSLEIITEFLHQWSLSLLPDYLLGSSCFQVDYGLFWPLEILTFKR